VARFLDRWTVGPVGVSQYTAERIQRLLEPDEQLRFVFEAQTKRTRGRLVLHGVLSLKGNPRILGNIYVVITDRAVLLVDMEEVIFLEDRRLYADLPIPSTLGPVTGRGWIVLNRKSIFVPGGKAVIEKAEAALGPRS
jgi:hypothetical protein